MTGNTGERIHPVAKQYAICLETAFAATTGAKAVLMAIPSSAGALTLVEFGVTMDGVSASAVPGFA